MNSISLRWLRLVSLILIIIGVGYQTSISFNTVPALTQEALKGDATYRSARSLEGEEFAQYIQFLRDKVPADAKIMLPPRTIFHPVAHLGLMQFLLFPRELHNCGPNEIDACIDRINTSENFYIIGVWDFPPTDLVNPSRQLQIFSEDLGLYLPPG